MIERSAIVSEARAWIGTPYRHQASLKGVGCDCLGLVRGLWRFLYGTEPEAVPAYSSDWAEGGRRETLLETARRHMIERPIGRAEPGDVLLFRWKDHLPAKHCAVLTTPRRIVHAYDAARKVAEGNLQAQWDKRIVAAFAFPGVEPG